MTHAEFIKMEGNYKPDEPLVYGKLGRALDGWKVADVRIAELEQRIVEIGAMCCRDYGMCSHVGGAGGSDRDDTRKRDECIAALTEALKKYGAHDDDCDLRKSDKHGGGWECTCGFDVALNAASAGKVEYEYVVVPEGVRWNAERGHYEEEVCLGCAKPSRVGDCGCPAGTVWRRWNGATNA